MFSLKVLSACPGALGELLTFMRKRKLSWLVRMSLVGLGIFAALALLEFGLRVWGQVAMIPSMFVEDPYTSYRLKPSVRARAVIPGVYEYEWTTNQQGLRAREAYRIPREAGTHRVLVIGDSFTFGIGVNDDETFSALLQGMLEQSCPTMEVEVINAGVGGWSTSHELEFLERFGLSFEADVVVLGFFGNDLDGNSSSGIHYLEDGELFVSPVELRPSLGRLKRVTELIPAYDFLVGHSVLVNWLRTLYFKLSRPAPSDTPPKEPPGQEAVGTESGDREHQWLLMEKLIVRMESILEAVGTRFLVLVIPNDHELVTNLGSAEGNSLPVAGMMSLCTRLQLSCFDLLPVLSSGFSTENGRVYIEGDGHMTALGHQLAAEALNEPVAQVLNCS
ncbi:MAG: SGNH/GDSL hydrolase family protein [Gemmatimonadetes bacterium]|nr:SGNH/GDSL hydrolase family protein [Gemmatimonadota bacterium]